VLLSIYLTMAVDEKITIVFRNIIINDLDLH